MLPLNAPASIEELVILPAALILDLSCGELPEGIHPTVWMGRVADFFESKLKTGQGEKGLVSGIVLVVISLTFFVVPIYFLSIALRTTHWLVYMPIMVLLLKSSFAIRSMEEHVKPIISALEEGDLGEARNRTSRIVSRNTSELDAEETLSATIESTGEGITDGIVSPLFFFIILGVPGAIAFRAINTLDSMFGYRDPGLKDFGWASAKMDTILNFLPARLTVLLIAVSAWMLGEDWREAFGCAIEEGSKTPSLNAGWPMAAAAGALNVRLVKRDEYVLGHGNPAPSTDHALRALGIMKTSAILFSGVILAFFGLTLVV